MLSQDYLTKGITALSRAIDHRWNEGHFGCAVIAAYFLCREQELDAETVADLEGELVKMIAAYEHLFVPLKLGSSRPELLGEITAALEGNIDKLCPGGHNVIYATLAIKALQQLPEMITTEVVSGIRRLIESFIGRPAQGDFYGVDFAELAADVDHSIPAYASAEAIASFTFSEMLKFEPMYYEIQGVVGHLATHAHTLIELARLGYPELARQGHDAHKVHARQVRLFHHHFDKTKWTPVRPVHGNPLKPSFWENDREAMAQSSWGYGHFFKYRYQFYDLVKLVRDPDLKARCLDRMADYVMNDFKAQGRKPSEFFVPLSR